MEWFAGGFDAVGGFLGENVGIEKIVGVFEAFVSEPENVEARLVAGEKSPCPQFSLSPILPGFTGRGS